MANNETTTKFNVDITQLKSQFQEAQRQIKLVNSEFKAATAGMDNWAKTSDGLTAKINQLNGVLDGEKSKLQSLKEQYRLVVEEQGENSKAAQELAIKINNQQAAVNSTEKSLRNYVKQLEDLENASDDAADNMDDLADASNDTVENMDDLGDSAEDAEDGFTVLKGTIATFAGNVLSNLVSKLGEALSSMWNLAEETKEFRDQMHKLESAAKTGGYSVDSANKMFKKFYSVLGDETASNTATSNLLASGMAMDDLNKITHSMIGIWAQYGDSIPLDGLAESINETARVGQITGNLADALNWAGINEDDFNVKLSECSSEQERQALIANTLQNQYGELSDAYMENNESIMRANEANLEYEENLAKIGEKIEPIQTELKIGFNNILSSFVDMLDGVDFDLITEQIRNAFEKISNIDWKSIGEKIESGIGVVKEIFNWILDNKAIVISAITSIVTGLLAFNVASIIIALTTAFKKLTLSQLKSAIAQKLLNTTMLKNPIALVIAAIAALVAGFIVLWNTSDEFREFWINLWEKIKDVVLPVWQKIKEIVFAAIEKIKEIWNTMLPYISAIWEKIKEISSTVGTAIAGFFSAAWQKIKEIWNAAQPYFQMVYDNIVSPLVEIGKSMFNAFHEAWLLIKTVWDLVSPYFASIWETIKEVFSYVKDYFYNVFQAAWGVIQIIWGIAAPYFQTVWDNIVAIFSVVKPFFEGMFSVAWEAIKTIWNAATGFFKNIWDTIATIFSVVRNVLEGNWSDAWNAIKNIVKQWAGYFGDVWDDIKNVFAAVKDWFKETFEAAWEAVKEVFSNWGDFFSGLWTDIQDKFTLIGTNIADAISGAVTSGINGVISLIEGTINSGIDLINGAINWINEIPGVDIGYFGSLNLPRLAKGGIVNSPTIAEIGEQGREAVIPLQNNLGWLKELAAQLSKEMNQNVGFNNSTSNSTVNNFYQTNNSPKSLSRLEIYRQSKNLLSFKGV